MDAVLPTVLLGLFLGIQHATDPDHVVAVATIVSQRPRFRAGALVGLLWGLGHTATVFLGGGAIILLNVSLTPRTELSFEMAVAAMLIVLGAVRLLRTFRGMGRVHPEHLGDPHEHEGGEAFHSHAHGHGGLQHSHPHLHPSGRLLRALRAPGLRRGVWPLLIGAVHGLAGSAVIALLVLGTIRDPAWGLAYLLVFGAGTILGMVAMTAALTAPFALLAGRFERLNRALALGTGMASLCLGLFLAYQIGFVEGLLRP
jgi:ABC-type nickel/cobalt efflux system permease component RcnA